MDTLSAGVTPAADASASAATKTNAPPVENRPRTIADFVKTASESLRSSEAKPDPGQREKQPPQAAATQESPATAQTAESVDLSQSNEASQTEEQASDVTPDDSAETAGHDDDHAEGKWPKGAIERTKKLKAQRNELRQKLASAEDRLRQLEAQSKMGPTAPQDTVDHFSGATTPEAIQQVAEQAKKVARTMESLIDETVDDPESVANQLRNYGIQLEEYTPETMRKQLRRIRDSARAALEQAPDRIRQIEQRKHFSAHALQTIPDLGDEDSDLAQIVGQARQAYPGLQQRPDADLQYAIYALGWQEYQKRTQSAKQPAQKQVAQAKPLPKAPASIPAPKAAPGPAPDRDELVAAGNAMRSSKGMDGVMKYARAAVSRTKGA